MQIGRYDQEITFNNLTAVSDGYGGYTNNSTPVLTTFARVEQLRQSRSLSEVQQSLPTALRVGIHYESFNPTLDNTVTWNGNQYNIITTPTMVYGARNVREWVFDIAIAK